MDRLENFLIDHDISYYKNGHFLKIKNYLRNNVLIIYKLKSSSYLFGYRISNKTKKFIIVNYAYLVNIVIRNFVLGFPL